MTDDPNSVADALDPSDEWTVPDLLRAIETAVNDGEYDTAYLLMPAARLLRESAGTAERLAAAELDAVLFKRQRDAIAARLSALTAAIDKLIGWAESYRMHHVAIALRDALAAAVSPTPTPDNEEPTDDCPRCGGFGTNTDGFRCWKCGGTGKVAPTPGSEPPPTLTGDCSIDCLEQCAYPGIDSACELGAGTETP